VPPPCLLAKNSQAKHRPPEAFASVADGFSWAAVAVARAVGRHPACPDAGREKRRDNVSRRRSQGSQPCCRTRFATANGPAEAGRYRRKNLEQRFEGASEIDVEILRCAQDDSRVELRHCLRRNTSAALRPPASGHCYPVTDPRAFRSLAAPAPAPHKDS
jgi:hypothetical protein